MQTEEACTNKLQPDIKKISAWAKRNKITLSAAKTKTLTETRMDHGMFSMYMDGQFIEEVLQHHHLGITLQRNGRWTKNVEIIIKKANKRLFILRRYTKHFCRSTLSYIRPLLEHGSQVWTYLTIHKSEAVEEVQGAAIRIITGLKIGTSHQALYDEIDLPTLAY